MNNRSTGNKGEDLATQFLEKKGHFIIERNFLTDFGEIDVITLFKNDLYIYEVKLRQNLEYGFGDDSITSSKINKIKKAFDIWISTRGKEYKFENIYMNALIIDPDNKINEFEIL